MDRRALLIVAAIVGVAAAGLYIAKLRADVATLRGEADTPRGAQPAEPAANRPGMSAPPRSITEQQRQTMLEVLKAETDPARTVWLQTDERNSEAAAYQKQLAELFKEAGWKVEQRGSAGLTFKPGLYLLVGEEEWPSYASTAYDAFDKAGIEVKAARGYRAYYDQQKKEKPGWQGPALAPTQTYVILIGPNPPPA